MCHCISSSCCNSLIDMLDLTADRKGAVRIDLDDLGGEVCLIDWGEGEVFVSEKLD